MSRTTPDLPVARHRGAATGIVLTLSPPVSTLFVGQIAVTPDATQSAAVGPITVGSETAPGRADLRAPSLIFEPLLALAIQPQSVKLVVRLTYDEVTLRVESIDCRLAGSSAAAAE